MSERILEIIIPPEVHPVRLDRYLSSRFSYLSRSAWQKEIDEGKIVVNGITVTDASRKIKGGDTVTYDGRRITEPPVDDGIDILYEDERCLIAGKSGDLPVHPAGRYFKNTFTMIMEGRRGRRIYPVHRLDRETSGVILSVFDTGDVHPFATAIQNGVKEYLAIVHGAFPDGVTRVDLPIGADAGSEVAKKRKAFPGAEEESLTEFRCEKHFGDFSLVRALPETGRLHQIRVHLLAAGFPLVGDKLYGRDDRLFLEFIRDGMTEELSRKLILPRAALHAERLTFIHPFEKKEMIIVSPLPTMFTDFISERSHG